MSLTELSAGRAKKPPVLDRVWKEGSSVLVDLWLRQKTALHDLLYSKDNSTIRSGVWWQLQPVAVGFFWRHNLPMRLPMKRCAVSLSKLPWWCLYLSLYIAYRWPHSSISHNSAARWESQGPFHSSVVFHSSSPAILPGKGIEFLL